MTKQELKQKADKLPELPGIYIMKDEVGAILYIGKSKSLRNRVKTYFGNAKIERKKIKKLIHHIDDFEYVLTDTELEALLLECRMIKKHRPMYNTLLKNDKKYRYLKISDNLLEGVGVAYEKENDGIYFGPFDLKSLLIDAAEAINRYYQLPTCKEQKGVQDCLEYKLGYCSGVCVKKIVEYDVSQRNQKLFDFFDGTDEKIIDFYKEKMLEASMNFEFEKARVYRDYIKVLKMLGIRRKSMIFSMENKKGVAVVPMAKGYKKVFYLEGTYVKRTLIVECEEEIQELKRDIEGFKKEPSKARVSLKKDEIDEVQIMYGYIYFRDEVEYI